ncbi:MAG: hypothetical protein U9O96_07685 [Candidatus Thermoplasmatota archaeon]|nr:hypothetical protein [Candidatus Thermoplasmatota archaeon]
MRKWWLLLFVALLILSVDFWNWNGKQIMWFMPLWAWHIFILALLLSASFSLFAKYEWRDE